MCEHKILFLSLLTYIFTFSLTKNSWEERKQKVNPTKIHLILCKMRVTELNLVYSEHNETSEYANVLIFNAYSIKIQKRHGQILHRLCQKETFLSL
jgi:hypothetical protein